MDELRARLRQLGYLDAGIDRFVLASAQQGHSATAVALMASLRVGLLGGLLLGPAAALGLAARLPGLINGTRDVLVLTLYTATLFAIAIAAAALVVSLTAARVARRAGPALARRSRTIAITAGAGLGLACLVYLSMLWTTVSSGWSAVSTGGDVSLIAGFGVAAAASLLLGHAVMVTALAVLVAGAESPVAAGTMPRTSWRAHLTLGGAAFAGALLVFALARPTAAPPPLSVISSGERIRVVAVDGLDTRVFDRLAAAGRIPALASALGEGTARLRLDPPDGASGVYDPARLWTSIATGQPAGVHGVESLETRRVAGVSGSLGNPASRRWSTLRAALDLIRLTRPAVASGSDRRVKTFWEVAAAAGLRTAVVNWWATWPAPAASGIVLSDRALLRLERGGTLEGELAPPEIYAELSGRWPALNEAGAALVTSLTTPDQSPLDATDALLSRALRLDAMIRVLTGAVAGPRTDLLVSYYPGLDIVRHAATAASPQTLERYYTALDRLLAPVLTPAAGELLVVIAAPGRVASGSEGRVAVRGQIAASGTTLPQTLAARDVAPTLLYALGLPISRELPGTPATALLTPRFVERIPVRFVSAYARPQPAAATPGGDPLDGEMFERLRSLGYVR